LVAVEAAWRQHGRQCSGQRGKIVVAVAALYQRNGGSALAMEAAAVVGSAARRLEQQRSGGSGSAAAAWRQWAAGMVHAWVGQKLFKNLHF
jgi:hypothetical protein